MAEHEQNISMNRHWQNQKKLSNKRKGNHIKNTNGHEKLSLYIHTCGKTASQSKGHVIASKSSAYIESHGTGHVSWVLNNDTEAVEDA